MKKFTSLMLAFTFVVSMLTGCSNNEEEVQDTVVATITMADGEQALPSEFSDYAILDWGYLDHLIHLDAAPKASPITSEPAEDATDAQIVSYLDGYGRTYPDRSVLDGIEPINATDDGIDFEQLLDLDLNYIITSESNIEYSDKLNAIAPTYFLPSSLSYDEDGNKDWKQIHETLAQLVGKEEEAAANIATYDETVASYQAAFEDAGIDLEGKTAIVTQISTKGVQYSLAASHPHVYEQLGLSLPEGFPTESGYLALENLIEYDPDYLFINVESWEDFATYEASPIWQNLTAVQNGNVFEFAHNVWNRSNGSMVALMRVSDVGDFILDGTQVTARYDYID
ncbi:ABC transporter substrate-binding protein [Tannockella kyphosi]|uniref:ABC transporter substrate-binding protein n=1 Tax=Tannockella kyphosi TaxID=2899121 RepID=UPI0020113882|nr:ABC transporter substrate-binding protein [Tannockella kyphosi]